MLYPAELRARGKRSILPYSALLSLMSRNPFVWEIQVRREVLDDEMARLREVPYSLGRTSSAPISKVVNGRDNKPYLLRVTAECADGSTTSASPSRSRAASSAAV